VALSNLFIVIKAGQAMAWPVPIALKIIELCTPYCTIDICVWNIYDSTNTTTYNIIPSESIRDNFWLHFWQRNYTQYSDIISENAQCTLILMCEWLIRFMFRTTCIKLNISFLLGSPLRYCNYSQTGSPLIIALTTGW